MESRMKINLKICHVAAGLTTVVALAGCGGTGAGAGGPAPEAQQQSVAQATQYSIQLQTSSMTLASDGSAPVELTAIVANESGVASAGVPVSFSVNDPMSGSRIEVTQGTTDSRGVALARLILSGSGAARSLKVVARVGTATTSEANISVAAATTSGSTNSSRGQLSVRVGTDSLIEDMKDRLTYRKRYAIIVSDNAGIPKANATVTATLRPKAYRVGYWAPCDTCGDAKWGQIVLSPPADIPSEDMNNPGVCDSGEDVNNDKVLTPGNVISYTVDGPTDASGLTVMSIVYPKSFARWATATVEVTATVGGTEAYNALTIPLPILASDLSTPGTPPPSIDRTRGSLSTSTMPFPLTSEEVAAGMTEASGVSGSPFPYLSISASCR